ncbi:hypothetical protein [Archangium sp.]|jgi:hypothetical protein|uniref:hypothetical protein n=1 Tax=Archangium sp. TaxID=1872627 RepID=UPI003899ADC8
MNGWIALSLSLMLGQTPTPSSTASAPTKAQAESAVRDAERDETRAELELLRAQMRAQQENQGRLQSLEQQQTLKDARAQRLEQLRQQRIGSLTRGYDWLITASQLLEYGDFDIGPAITYAQDELSTALATSSESGSGETTRLIQSALARLSTLDDLVAQRNSYEARLQLQDAGLELHLAWQLSLNRSGTTLVNQ